MAKIQFDKNSKTWQRISPSGERETLGENSLVKVYDSNLKKVVYRRLDPSGKFAESNEDEYKRYNSLDPHSSRLAKAVGDNNASIIEGGKDIAESFQRIWNQDAAEKKYWEAQDPNTNLYTTQFFKFVNNPYLSDDQFRETLSSTSREKYLTEFEDKNKNLKSQAKDYFGLDYSEKDLYYLRCLEDIYGTNNATKKILKDLLPDTSDEDINIIAQNLDDSLQGNDRTWVVISELIRQSEGKFKVKDLENLIGLKILDKYSDRIKHYNDAPRERNENKNTGVDKEYAQIQKRLKNKEISTWESYQDTFEASLAAVGASIGHYFQDYDNDERDHINDMVERGAEWYQSLKEKRREEDPNYDKTADVAKAKFSLEQAFGNFSDPDNRVDMGLDTDEAILKQADRGEFYQAVLGSAGTKKLQQELQAKEQTALGWFDETVAFLQSMGNIGIESALDIVTSAFGFVAGGLEMAQVDGVYEKWLDSSVVQWVTDSRSTGYWIPSKQNKARYGIPYTDEELKEMYTNGVISEEQFKQSTTENSLIAAGKMDFRQASLKKGAGSYDKYAVVKNDPDPHWFWNAENAASMPSVIADIAITRGGAGLLKRSALSMVRKGHQLQKASKLAKNVSKTTSISENIAGKVLAGSGHTLDALSPTAAAIMMNTGEAVGMYNTEVDKAYSFIQSEEFRGKVLAEANRIAALSDNDPEKQEYLRKVQEYQKIDPLATLFTVVNKESQDKYLEANSNSAALNALYTAQMVTAVDILNYNTIGQSIFNMGFTKVGRKITNLGMSGKAPKIFSLHNASNVNYKEFGRKDLLKLHSKSMISEGVQEYVQAVGSSISRSMNTASMDSYFKNHFNKNVAVGTYGSNNLLSQEMVEAAILDGIVEGAASRESLVEGLIGGLAGFIFDVTLKKPTSYKGKEEGKTGVLKKLAAWSPITMKSGAWDLIRGKKSATARQINDARKQYAGVLESFATSKEGQAMLRGGTDLYTTIIEMRKAIAAEDPTSINDASRKQLIAAANFASMLDGTPGMQRMIEDITSLIEHGTTDVNEVKAILNKAKSGQNIQNLMQSNTLSAREQAILDIANGVLSSQNKYLDETSAKDITEIYNEGVNAAQDFMTAKTKMVQYAREAANFTQDNENYVLNTAYAFANTYADLLTERHNRDNKAIKNAVREATNNRSQDNAPKNAARTDAEIMAYAAKMARKQIPDKIKEIKESIPQLKETLQELLEEAKKIEPTSEKDITTLNQLISMAMAISASIDKAKQDLKTLNEAKDISEDTQFDGVDFSGLSVEMMVQALKLDDSLVSDILQALPMHLRTKNPNKSDAQHLIDTLQHHSSALRTAETLRTTAQNSLEYLSNLDRITTDLIETQENYYYSAEFIPGIQEIENSGESAEQIRQNKILYYHQKRDEIDEAGGDTRQSRINGLNIAIGKEIESLLTGRYSTVQRGIKELSSIFDSIEGTTENDKEVFRKLLESWKDKVLRYDMLESTVVEDFLRHNSVRVVNSKKDVILTKFQEALKNRERNATNINVAPVTPDSATQNSIQNQKEENKDNPENKQKKQQQPIITQNSTVLFSDKQVESEQSQDPDSLTQILSITQQALQDPNLPAHIVGNSRDAKKGVSKVVKLSEFFTADYSALEEEGYYVLVSQGVQVDSVEDNEYYTRVTSTPSGIIKEYAYAVIKLTPEQIALYNANQEGLVASVQLNIKVTNTNQKQEITEEQLGQLQVDTQNKKITYRHRAGLQGIQEQEPITVLIKNAHEITDKQKGRIERIYNAIETFKKSTKGDAEKRKLLDSIKEEIYVSNNFTIEIKNPLGRNYSINISSTDINNTNTASIPIIQEGEKQDPDTLKANLEKNMKNALQKLAEKDKEAVKWEVDYVKLHKDPKYKEQILKEGILYINEKSYQVQGITASFVGTLAEYIAQMSGTWAFNNAPNNSQSFISQTEDSAQQNAQEWANRSEKQIKAVNGDVKRLTDPNSRRTGSNQNVVLQQDSIDAYADEEQILTGIQEEKDPKNNSIVTYVFRQKNRSNATPNLTTALNTVRGTIVDAILRKAGVLIDDYMNNDTQGIVWVQNNKDQVINEIMNKFRDPKYKNALAVVGEENVKNIISIFLDTILDIVDRTLKGIPVSEKSIKVLTTNLRLAPLDLVQNLTGASSDLFKKQRELDCVIIIGDTKTVIDLDFKTMLFQTIDQDEIISSLKRGSTTLTNYSNQVQNQLDILQTVLSPVCSDAEYIGSLLILPMGSPAGTSRIGSNTTSVTYYPTSIDTQESFKVLTEDPITAKLLLPTNKNNQVQSQDITAKSTVDYERLNPEKKDKDQTSPDISNLKRARNIRNLRSGTNGITGILIALSLPWTQQLLEHISYCM